MEPSKIVPQIFSKMGWDTNSRTAQERLLYEARFVVATKFGGHLPCRIKINGKRIAEIPRQDSISILRRWINGESVRFGGRSFYNQIVALLEKVGGLESDQVDILVISAVFERVRGKKKLKFEHKKYLRELEQVVAIKFNGALPRLKKINRKGTDEKSFERNDVDKLTIKTVFEKKGWDKYPRPTKERLLYKSRHVIATKFVGALPTLLKIDGKRIVEIPMQISTAKLTRWINGECVRFGKGAPAHSFYTQIRALLEKVGNIEKDEVDKLIIDDIFKNKGWDKEPENAQEKLLFESRRVVAIKFGGDLPQFPKIDGKRIVGIPAQTYRSILTRWINRGRAKLHVNELMEQIKTLLINVGGMDQSYVQNLIESVLKPEKIVH